MPPGIARSVRLMVSRYSPRQVLEIDCALKARLVTRRASLSALRDCLANIRACPTGLSGLLDASSWRRESQASRKRPFISSVGVEPRSLHGRPAWHSPSGFSKQGRSWHSGELSRQVAPWSQQSQAKSEQPAHSRQTSFWPEQAASDVQHWPLSTLMQAPLIGSTLSLVQGS